MRNKIRAIGLIVTSCMLFFSFVGCAGAPDSTPTSQTPAPHQSPGASAQPEEVAPEPEESVDMAYRPVIEEDLSEEALDVWIDFKIMLMNNDGLPDLREYIQSSFPAVPIEVADGMVWEYIKAVRSQLESMSRYILTPERQEALYNAYQSDGSFDLAALDDNQKYVLDSIKEVEIGWMVLEESLEPCIRYDRIAEWIGPASAGMREYVDLLAMENTAPPAEFGALTISYQELGERTLRIEGFLDSALEAPYRGDVEALYLRYLDLLLSGADIPSVMDMALYYENDTLAMNPDARAAFQQIVDASPQSTTAAAVQDWEKYLSDLIDSGVSGENAYQQIWEDFTVRIEQYASAAGVRVPRVSLSTRTDQTDTEIFYADVQYPLLYGEGVPEGVLAQMEDRITTDIQKDYTEVEDLAVPDHDLAAEDGYELPPYGFYATLRLPREAGPVVSVVADTDIYLGGAHGTPIRTGYNFDIMTGDEVKLTDLFKENTDPLALLEEDITRQITLIQERTKETEGESAYIPYDMYTGLTLDHTWYVTDEGIVVVFQVYEIGPYAMGLPEFTVPWWRLSDYLK